MASNFICVISCEPYWYLRGLQVKSGDALLIEGNEITPYTEPVLFCTSTHLQIGLLGKPGTRGTLSIIGAGQLSSRTLELVIPFRLRPCHVGFTETPEMMHNSTEASIVEIKMPGKLRAGACFCLLVLEKRGDLSKQCIRLSLDQVPRAHLQ